MPIPPPRSPMGPPMGPPMGGPPPPLLGATPPASPQPALPMGGSLPSPDANMGGSDLLAAIASTLGAGGGGQDLAMTPGGDTGLNVGAEDPNMGLMQLLQALCLGSAGVGGNVGGNMAGDPNRPQLGPVGSSGVPMNPGLPGGMMGMGY